MIKKWAKFPLQIDGWTDLRNSLIPNWETTEKNTNNKLCSNYKKESKIKPSLTFIDEYLDRYDQIFNSIYHQRFFWKLKTYIFRQTAAKTEMLAASVRQTLLSSWAVVINGTIKNHRLPVIYTALAQSV